MKKTYIQPTMEVAEIETRLPMLTVSGNHISIKSDTNDAVEENAQLSRRQDNIWDDDEEEEEY